MTDGSAPKGLDRVVDRLLLIPDPLLRLDAARRGRELLAAVEAAAVRDARQAGATWKAIGALYGLSKQGAQQRFGGAVPDRAPETEI